MVDFYIKEFNDCITLKDIEKLFKNTEFPNGRLSLFFDKSILLKTSPKIFGNHTVKLEGIWSLYLRVMLFFKLHHKIGKLPFNSGESTYFRLFHNLFQELSSLKDINSMDEIDSDLIDTYIKSNIERSQIKFVTLKKRVDILFENLKYEDELNLPSILRLDENAIKYSKQYNKLSNLASCELSNKELISSKDNNYSLEDLKVIISTSITFLEDYADEILELAWHYRWSSKLLDKEKYTYLYEYFLRTPKEFSEPNLKKIQCQIKSFDSTLNKLPTITELIEIVSRKILNDVIERLEVSCISIAFMMTGMRVGELVNLERDLNIQSDEHDYLERMVYKTASRPEGEPLTMPIPLICKDALITLSKLAVIKDGKKNGSLILSSITKDNATDIKVDRINYLLKAYCKDLGLENVITSHRFRHAMAFLITHIYDNEGLELARMFLGHSSIAMTLQYMGYYNNELKDAIRELIKEESEFFIDAIADEVEKDRMLFGEKGARIVKAKTKFAGRYANDFIQLMKKGLMELIKKQKLAIIQTPVSLCIHDLSKPEELVCQRGFEIDEIVANGPAPERCKGANCSNALFFEKHVRSIKEKMYSDIEPSLRKRLEQNTYFMDAGGFEQDPYRRVVKEYDEYKQGVV